MAKKKKKPPCAAGHGRTKAGKCRKGPKRRKSKKKSSGRSKLGKPTPLFADVVQFARGARKFPCGSDQRALFRKRANEYLKAAAELDEKHALSETSRFKRVSALARAGKQVDDAVMKDCTRMKKSSSKSWENAKIRRRLTDAGLPVPSYLASGSPTGQNVPRSSANQNTTTGAQKLTKKTKSAAVPDFMIPMLEKLEAPRHEVLHMPTHDDPRVLDMPDDDYVAVQAPKKPARKARKAARNSDEVVTYQTATPPRQRPPSKKKPTGTKSLPPPAVQTEWEEFKTSMKQLVKTGEALSRKMAKQSA